MPDIAIPSARPIVLVVEDEPIIRLVANDILDEAGFQVEEAATASEAIALLDAKREIAVLFTDVHTPGEVDGLTLARMAQTRWPWVKVAVTSGRARPAADELPAGVLFVPKPYAASQLVSGIQALFKTDGTA